MWSILPGVYGKYFGLKLSTIAGVVLLIRIFDGIIDTTIGYLSDRHRASGGSRKKWVIWGSLAAVVACYFLFIPSRPTTSRYYTLWAMTYFLAFTIAEIPHLTWGSELTMDYQRRARVYGVRNVAARLGIIIFYAMPLLPIYATTEYTPEVLRDAVSIGGILTVLGIVWSAWGAPAGSMSEGKLDDSVRLFVGSLLHNRPLLMYFAAFGFVGLCSGMWHGLLFFYLDGYLGLGREVAVLFLCATVLATVATPIWLRLISRTGKATTWAMGIFLFLLQLVGTLFVAPGSAWWWVLGMVVLANLSFSCHDVAALSILGDIVDYGKLKFHRDRGATYFAVNTLIFKLGLGAGGAVALGAASLFGFDPLLAAQSPSAVAGLRIGFIVLPACCAIAALFLIWRTPISRHRHGIIQRRLASRLLRVSRQASG